jgi:hypothetical protein
MCSHNTRTHVIPNGRIPERSPVRLLIYKKCRGKI